MHEDNHKLWLMKSTTEGNDSGGSLIGSGSNDPLEHNSTIEQQSSPPAKKKRIFRHTARQIETMEALFEERHYLDDKQRMKLSKDLGLTPRQIHNWFQNRRSQIKAQQDRRESLILKAENKKLKTEKYKLQSLKCLSCSSSGGSVNELRLENARLRLEVELDRLCSMTSLVNHLSLPPAQDNIVSLPPPQDNIVCYFPEIYDNDLLLAEEEKAIARDLAVSYVQELVKMCECDTIDPFWNKKKSVNDDIDQSLLCMDEEEFKKMLTNNNGERRFRREFSRANTVVLLNNKTLVDTFLDADKWSDMFSSIVSRAKTVQTISLGVSRANGCLLLMYAELQTLTPVIPTRELYFLRYAEQNMEQGKSVIVDFPIDSLNKPTLASATSTNQYWRKLSGCIIQDIPNGYSQVTWVEHVEVEEDDDKHVQGQHEAVREYVKSGVAFGAERWLDVLRRHCERTATFMSTNFKDLGVIPSIEGKQNLMKLSQEMVKTFCKNISDPPRYWFESTRKDIVRITTRNVCGDVILCAVSTTLLPFSYQHVFNILRDHRRRSELEICFNDTSFQEVAYIANGSHPGNYISLLRNDVEFMLQESCVDNSGSLVIYSTVVFDAFHLVINGKDESSIVPLFPVGFSVVPVFPKDGVDSISVNSPSCLYTVMIQVNAVTAELSLSTIAAIDNCICSTVNKITSVFGSSSSSATGN